MDNEPTSNHAPVPTDAGVPATPQPGVLDANGFDPTEFEWRPVPRRPRKDGWTPEVQQRFIAALMRTGMVERACEEVGMSVRSAYDLRNAPGGEGFARAWRAALMRAADRVLDLAFEQAIVGEEIPVHDQDGVRTGVKWKYNTRMAMFLLKAYHPERFGQVGQPTRTPPQLPATEPVVATIASLAPVTPAQPQLFAPPARVNVMVHFARAEAAALAANPPDETEGYRPTLVPAGHPNVVTRAHRSRVRRAAREWREDKRHGFDTIGRYGPNHPGPDDPA